MTHVDVTVPDGLLAALKKAPHEVAAELRLAAAIHWYQQSLLSMERAAETAGMPRAEFLAELTRRRVDVFVVDDQDLARELGDESTPASSVVGTADGGYVDVRRGDCTGATHRRNQVIDREPRSFLSRHSSPAITQRPRHDLRAGTVKARRPRARAGGAQRSALHGAEHRSNINRVMADVSNVAPIVDPSETSK